MKTVECKIRVRYNEIGRQGYAHHANYMNWFDIAQENLISACDMSYKDVEDLGYFFATIKDVCTYIHPARYNDELTIRLSVSDLSAIKVNFAYEIVREKDAKLIATGQSSHVFVDNDLRPHSLKKVAPKLYAKIEELL